jgi:hypothetical protein
MQKKDTAKPKPTKAELRQQLVHAIASILANPTTPVGLFNAIAEEMTEWQTDRDNDKQSGWRTTPFIADCLEAYERAEKDRTGGQS